MKSSIAAPCLRNSGLLTTLNVCVVCFAITSRTRFAVPTGTVLLSTTTVYLFIAPPGSGLLWRATGCLFIAPADVARDGEHVLQVGGAVLTLRRADGDEDDL